MEIGKKFFRDAKEINENGYGIKEVFNCSGGKEKLFWALNTFKFNRKVLVPDGIRRSIEMLRNQGHKVYILSARAMADRKTLPGLIMRNEIRKALKRNRVVTDGIIYVSAGSAVEDKKTAVLKYNIRAMVDDYKDVLKEVMGITKTFAIRTRNNSSECMPEVEMAENYNELYLRLRKWSEGIAPKWHPLNYKELETLSEDERREYYCQLKDNIMASTDKYKIELDDVGCRRIMKKIQKAFNIIYRPHMIHPEKFPKNGGIILACNHLHSYDPLVIMQMSKLPFHLLAKEELKNNKTWDKLFTSIGSIFVKNSDPESREKAKWDLVKMLFAGRTVMMFPEGTRNRTEEKLLPFHMGTINIAMFSGCPIIPLAINADYRLFKNRLVCSVGDPIVVKTTDDAVAMNNVLRKKILDLMDEVNTFQKSRL